MTFEETQRQLMTWGRKSAGVPISMSDGERFSFLVRQRYAVSEIMRFEEAWSVSLPADYREFLVTVGAGDYFINEYGLGVLVHRLETIEEYTAQVFSGHETPFPRLLVAVSLSGRGDEGCFNTERQASPFSVFSGEEDVERWGGDATWVEFAEWLDRLVASEGEDDLP